MMMHRVVHPWMDQQHQWPPMMAHYVQNQAPPPAWNPQPPMMAPYLQNQAPPRQNYAPPPAWNQQPPMMSPYLQNYAPPPAWNQQPPMMAPYLQNYAPPPAWNQQPPMIAPYLHNYAPPPAWNQQPLMMIAPYLQNQAPPLQNYAPPPAWNQQPLPQLVPQQQYSASPQPQPTTSAAEEEEVRTLWIGDLQYWMDEDFINLYCFPGEVFSSKVIRNKTTGKSKGYGFIVFQSHAIAHRILQRFNGAPMPMMGETKMRLNWITKKKKKKRREKQQQQQQRREEEDADDFAAASDIVTTTDNYMLQQEEKTFITSVKVAKGVTLGHAIPMGGGGGGQYGMGQFHYILHDAPLYPEEEGSYSNWENMLEKWRNIDQTQRPEPDTEVMYIQNKFRTAQYFKDMAYKQVSETVDVFQRVSEIAPFFEMSPMALEKLGVTPQRIEDLMDELQGYVESIDIANALHSIGGLVPFLDNLHNSHARIRAKVAEVITTMVQYYPRRKQLVMESIHTGLVLFNNFVADTDETARTNALGALSALIWNNISGITGFELKDIYESLTFGLEEWSSESVGFQRKALNLIHYLLHENNSDCNIVTESGLPRIMMHMASSVDAEVREAALGCLLLLARVEEGGNSGQLVKNDDKLKQVLQELVGGFSSMAPEDLGAIRKERRLVDSLWNACYNEPSPLEEKGLLVLPVEEPVSD